jgi:hypothetical protein
LEEPSASIFRIEQENHGRDTEKRNELQAGKWDKVVSARAHSQPRFLSSFPYIRTLVLQHDMFLPCRRFPKHQ